jgi:hypothetical protein
MPLLVLDEDRPLVKHLSDFSHGHAVTGGFFLIRLIEL